MIDITKPMRLRDGSEFDFWKIDNNKIHGRYKAENGEWFADSWDLDGMLYFNVKSESYLDIVNYNEWENVLIDTPVVCVSYYGHYYKGHFSGLDKEGKPTAFVLGKSSWLSDGDKTTWTHMRLATPEEIAQNKILED